MLAILRESTNRQSGVCLLRSRAIALLVFGICLRSAAHAARACVGDCDDSGGVSISELVRGVDIALGAAPLDDCGAFDANGDRRLSVEELVAGVDSAIHHCSRPSPTATITPVPKGPPEIDIAPTGVSLGCTGNFEIAVSNSGGAGSTLAIDVLTLANGYSQGDYGTGFAFDLREIALPVALAAGQSLRIPVSFSASGQAYRSRLELTVDSNADKSPQSFAVFFGAAADACATPTPITSPTRPIDHFPIALSTCSAADLIAAITAANRDESPTVIALAAGCTYELTAVDNTDPSAGANGLPVISSDVTIEGQGSAIERGSAPDFRIFQVALGATLRLRDVTIRRGFSDADENAGRPGGCIYNAGTLVAARTNFENCETSDSFGGSGGFRRGGDGGAIYNAEGTVMLTDSRITGSRTGGRLAPFEDSIGQGGSGGSGGGLYNDRGIATLVRCTVYQNTAGSGHRGVPVGYSGGNGGGIANAGGTLTLVATEVWDNTAGDGGQGGLGSSGGAGGSGGGVTNSGTLVVTDSTFFRNHGGMGGGGNSTSPSTGGGSGGSGGGIANFSTAIFTNTTISGNSSGGGGFGNPNGADGVGGGLFVHGDAELANVTITDNTALLGRQGAGLFVATPGGSTRLVNTILAGNTSEGGADCAGGAAGIVSAGYNLVGQSDGCDWPSAAGDQVGTAAAPIDPKLHWLGPYGGTTSTHELSIESPAVDAGDPAGCRDPAGEILSADQRGEPRIQDGNGDGRSACDIGAFELAPLSTPTATVKTATSSPAPSPTATKTPVIYGTPTGPIAIEIPSCETSLVVAAINAANHAVSASIDLAPDCTYQLSDPDNVDPTYGSNALPVIGGDIAIDGHGSVLGSFIGRVFQIAPGATLRLSNVTVSGGYAYGSTHEAHSGGGIYNRGTLILEAASVIHNRTADGPPNFRAGDGGGIYNDHGTVTATDSTISENSTGGGPDFETSSGYAGAGGLGAGILNSSGVVTLVRCAINGNVAGNGHRSGYPGGSGGGISNHGMAALTDSTVSGNRAGNGGQGGLDQSGGLGADGGGIDNHGTLAVIGCTISGNSAGNGGIGNPQGNAPTNGGAGGNGGGISNVGTLTVVNSTISGNSSGKAGQNYSTPPFYSDGDGGGIYGRGDLRNVTIAHNTAQGGRGGGVSSGALHIADSVLAGNTAGSQPDCRGNLISEGHNLIGSAEGCSGLAGEGDQLGTPELPIDPMLDELQNNGGPTLTHALLPGSPAIDGGDPDGCTDASGEPLASDQRGEPRAQGSDAQPICDIGAYERPEP